jgi:TPR repeat protein
MQRGCDQGSAVSCRRLGTLYQRGRGVAANRARAFELYDRACRAGDARGCALRDAADHSLNDVDRDDRADAEYFSTLGL